MNARHLFTASLVFWVGLSETQSRLVSHEQTQLAGSQVLFVGCESEGQVGPLKAPHRTAKKLTIPPELAGRLAYYKAENGFGVLAPRGWHCFSTYGSNGSTLYVTPETIEGKALFSYDWKGFSGQAIQVSVSAGDTSGRFAVARAIARLFPDHIAFVQDVIAEGIEPVNSFPTGPYPMDKMMYRGTGVVEFETPPNSKGLGTNSRLTTNSSPIRGVAILFGEEPNLVQASVRISDENRNLIEPILRQLQSDVAASDAEQGR
jgi:hypothetical protein